MRETIIQIISYEGGVRPEKIMDSARLEADLGITGDDLWDVIEHMDKELDINWGETDFSYFFYPEGAGLIWGLLHRDQVKSIKAHPITVSHLVKVAEAGAWFKPESSN